MRHRQTFLILRCVCLLATFFSLAWAEPITTPLPADIAARLAVRAAEARRANLAVRSWALYSEAGRLDPSKTIYLLNRDELAPLATLLLGQKLGSDDIKADVDACTLEATPGSDSNVAVHIAERAERARRDGDAVRAYLLYSAAADRVPTNQKYVENRNVLAPIAALLKGDSAIKTPDITADLKAAQLASLSGSTSDPAVSAVGSEWQQESTLADLPHVKAGPEHRDFDIKGDVRSLIQQVTSAYGVRAITDPELPRTGSYNLHMTDTDFHSAMEGLTAVTGTFVFPVSTEVVFFAQDTEAKRNELEPNVLLTVTLPDALGDKDLVEVANGVRSVLNLKSFGWDSTNHTVLIRDRFTRAHLAKHLLETLLIPHAQVSLELQFITVDSDVTNHWGFAPQTAFQVFTPLQKLFNFNTTFPALLSYVEGGGWLIPAGSFGIGVTSAAAFASYNKSTAKNLYDATVVVQDGETANLHVGEKYPIPQSLYTGASQTTSSIYNPIGTFTQEDLGLVLKVTPHVKGNGDVGMDIEADYKALGTTTIDTVPSVAQRKFSGSVTLRQDEWAILAGLDQDTFTRSRSGLAGLTSIPGLNHLLSENNREDTKSSTLVVLKPVVTQLPMSDAITPQFLVGPVRGVRVLL